MTAGGDNYVIMRLNRWSIYCIWKEDLLVRSPYPRRVTSWLGRIISGHFNNDREGTQPPKIIRKPCPVDWIEAEETDRCVKGLPDYLRCVVVLQYLTNMEHEEKAAAMQPPGAFKTFYRRLERAHYELLGLMNDAAAGIELPAAPTTPIAAA